MVQPSTANVRDDRLSQVSGFLLCSSAAVHGFTHCTEDLFVPNIRARFDPCRASELQHLPPCQLETDGRASCLPRVLFICRSRYRRCFSCYRVVCLPGSDCHSAPAPTGHEYRTHGPHTARPKHVQSMPVMPSNNFVELPLHLIL